MTVPQPYTLQVRKAGPRLWISTPAGEDSPLLGPDRWGDHAASFPTMADACHAAAWRVSVSLADRVEKGPQW